MEKLRANSRCIITDPIYQRITQKRYKNHLSTIKNPYSSSMHTSLKNAINDKSQQYALQISRYKKACLCSQQQIDPVILQNRSLIRKIQQIDKRKSKSLVNFKVPHTNKLKTFVQKIKQQNKHIFARIKNQRQNIMTKKQLKKQFSQVDKLIMHSRRIKQTIKTNNKNKKRIDFKFRNKQQKQFQFCSNYQLNKLPPVVNLR